MKTTIEILETNIPAILAVSVPIEDILKIIAISLSILTSLVILGKKIFDWYKEAKKDGKIDEKEKEELKNIAKDGASEIAEEVVELVETIEESKGDKK